MLQWVVTNAPLRDSASIFAATALITLQDGCSDQVPQRPISVGRDSVEPTNSKCSGHRPPLQGKPRGQGGQLLFGAPRRFCRTAQMGESALDLRGRLSERLGCRGKD